MQQISNQSARTNVASYFIKAIKAFKKRMGRKRATLAEKLNVVVGKQIP
jgi:hypothetical protein